MHHDGIHFFPLPLGARGSRNGLLAINHEYTDDGLLHADGLASWSAEKVAKAQNAHGVSIIEVQHERGEWRVVRPSRWARRITARTPMSISGPAAGSVALRTAADPTGTRVLGTVNNCAHGYTPWGTFLTCEENFASYFVSARNGDHHRYGVTVEGRGFRWHELDPRFDIGKEPNEVNRFGRVVEIDPCRPGAMPVKRTALRPGESHRSEHVAGRCSRPPAPVRHHRDPQERWRHHRELTNAAIPTLGQRSRIQPTRSR